MSKEKTPKKKPTKTPVLFFMSPSLQEVRDATMLNKPVPLPAPLSDPPFRMARGAPGSDNAVADARKRTVEAGHTIRSVNHTIKGELAVYLFNPDDEPQAPKMRQPRSSIPRKVR